MNHKFHILCAILIFSTQAGANTNCQLPDYCYLSNGSVRDGTESRLEYGELEPECQEKKDCPSYCKEKGAIVGSDGSFTGKYKVECMSDFLIKQTNELAKSAEETKKTKAKQDVEDSKRFRAAMTKENAEQLKKAKAAAALANNPKKFAQCYCNFSGCLGARKVNCTTVDRCKEISADVYATAVGNREALLVLNSHAYCANPTAGFMRGN